MTGLVTALFNDLNLLAGAAANGLTVDDVKKLADINAAAAELNVLDGILAGTAELNLLAGRSLASSDDVIDNFPAGTIMLFQQQAAPVGWIRQATHNNKSLRIVNGATWAGSGGSVAFSTVFGRTATDSIAGHVHSMAHTHTSGTLSGVVTGGANGGGLTGGNHVVDVNGGSTGGSSTANTGTSATHAHTMDLRVQFVDVVAAMKA